MAVKKKELSALRASIRIEDRSSGLIVLVAQAGQFGHRLQYPSLNDTFYIVFDHVEFGLTRSAEHRIGIASALE